MRALKIIGLVVLWYASSISIIFANKSLLTGRSFHSPFFMTTCNNGVVSAHGKGRPTCVAPGKGYPTGDENIAGTHEKGIHACDTKESSVEATRPITATESVAVVDTKEETASDRRDAPEYT